MTRAAAKLGHAAKSAEIAAFGKIQENKRSWWLTCERCVKYGLLEIVRMERPRTYRAAPGWQGRIDCLEGAKRKREKPVEVKVAAPNSVFDLGRFI